MSDTPVSDLIVAHHTRRFEQTDAEATIRTTRTADLWIMAKGHIENLKSEPCMMRLHAAEMRSVIWLDKVLDELYLRTKGDDD